MGNYWEYQKSPESKYINLMGKNQTDNSSPGQFLLQGKNSSSHRKCGHLISNLYPSSKINHHKMSSAGMHVHRNKIDNFQIFLH